MELEATRTPDERLRSALDRLAARRRVAIEKRAALEAAKETMLSLAEALGVAEAQLTQAERSLEGVKDEVAGADRAMPPARASAWGGQAGGAPGAVVAGAGPPPLAAELLERLVQSMGEAASPADSAKLMACLSVLRPMVATPPPADGGTPAALEARSLSVGGAPRVRQHFKGRPGQAGQPARQNEDRERSPRARDRSTALPEEEESLEGPVPPAVGNPAWDAAHGP